MEKEVDEIKSPKELDAIEESLLVDGIATEELLSLLNSRRHKLIKACEKKDENHKIEDQE